MARRTGWTALAASATLAVAFLLTGCSSSRELLTALFDGVPPPGEERPMQPVKKSPRRPPYKPPAAPVKIVEVPDLPPPVDWRARYQELAKNAAGEIDWIRALNERKITPKPGLAPDAKDNEPTDINLEYVPNGQSRFKVIFAHKPHTQWLGCPNCHTGIFEMQKGKASMSMEKLNAGAYCGVCHGKVASPRMANCSGCHKAM